MADFSKEKLESMLAAALEELKVTKEKLASASSSSSSSASETAPPVTLQTSLRSHTCDQLRMADVGKSVKLIGWVQTSRDLNHFAFIDLRDRYGITQCVFQNPGENGDKAVLERYNLAKKCGREFVISVTGTVVERSNKNKNRPTGDIEIDVTSVTLLNEAKTPPFLIEDNTDGKEEVRMKYRYLDIRRNPVKNALLLRAQLAMTIRKYLTAQKFCEIETPVLIKSTPEGARDFVVPSRMNPGQFYALPQSPQTFKQILMVAGMDRYFQIVKCFRDEELRADRQPEFTQIDCEMAFVSEEDVLNIFEEMVRTIFKEVVNHEFPKVERMTYAQAMEEYGSDKPDLRFDMKLKDITSLAKGHEFKALDDAELVLAIACPGIASWSTKKVKELEKLAKSQVVGAQGLVWVKVQSLKEGALKLDSTVKKFFSLEDLAGWAQAAHAKEGDLMLVLFGEAHKTRECMGKLRAEMGTTLGLRNKGFRALWVTEFPLLEYDEEEKRWTAMHHPFTSPHPDDMELLKTDPSKVRAVAYDFVINGVEMGGGSIRIHDRNLQQQVFQLLGFTPESAQEQFGFLMGAFEYGAPPHGGLAFGFDRMCTILGNAPSIRDYIAFPKNNMGRDMMINSPSEIAPKQKEELYIETTYKPEEKKS